MQAQKYLFSNSVSQSSYLKNGQSRKFLQVESFMSLIREMNIPEMGAFMLGYVIGELGINIGDKGNKQLLVKIGQTLEFVREGIIQKGNLVEALVETIERVKKMKESNKVGQKQQSCSSPKRISNKMLSQQQRMCSNSNSNYFHLQKSSLSSQIQQFIQTFQFLINQLACDSDYLSCLWHNEYYQQQQQLQSRQMIDRMIAQQSSKRAQQQNKTIQCQVCLVDIDFSDMAPLSGCKHIFHINCLNEYLKTQINANIVEIKCPMEECRNYLSVDDVETYVDGEVMDKYYKFCLNKYVQSGNNMTSWCPTAGCSAVFQYDEALDNYRCPVCRKHYCLKCRTDYHYGMTCDQYRISKTWSEDDKKFFDFVKGAKFKQCPKCKFWVERVAGCSSMNCRCGIQFCYDCGGTGCPHGSCSGSGRK